MATCVAIMPLVVTSGGSRTGRWVVFSLFLVLTPVLVWLFTACRARAAPFVLHGC